VPAHNQRLKQPGRASLRGQPKVIMKLGNPWPWVTEVAQILGLAKVNLGAPLCAMRECGHWRGVFRGKIACLLNKKPTKKYLVAHLAINSKQIKRPDKVFCRA